MALAAEPHKQSPQRCPVPVAKEWPPTCQRVWEAILITGNVLPLALQALPQGDSVAELQSGTHRVRRDILYFCPEESGKRNLWPKKCICMCTGNLVSLSRLSLRSAQGWPWSHNTRRQQNRQLKLGERPVAPTREPRKCTPVSWSVRGILGRWELEKVIPYCVYELERILSSPRAVGGQTRGSRAKALRTELTSELLPSKKVRPNFRTELNWLIAC